MATVSDSIPPMNVTMGALLIGMVLSSMLYGVTCTQVFNYFTTYKTDSLLVKLTVVLLWILESLHSALAIHVVYHYLILNYFNPPAVLEVGWSGNTKHVITSIIIVVVHLFYISRIWAMSHQNIMLTGFVLVLALAHSGAAMAWSVRLYSFHRFNQFWVIYDLIEASISLAVATDVAIALVLSYLLHKNRSGIKSTDALINRLMANVIENGLATSLCDIITLILLVTYPKDLLYLGGYLVVGNMYTNSVLASLNSRRRTATLVASTYKGSMAHGETSPRSPGFTRTIETKYDWETQSKGPVGAVELGHVNYSEMKFGSVV